MYLYHYYDRSGKPFRNLSELSVNEAQEVMRKIKAEKPNSQLAERHDKYVRKFSAPNFLKRAEKFFVRPLIIWWLSIARGLVHGMKAAGL